MGDPHNPNRMGELWDLERLQVLFEELEVVKDYGAISGGFAWHFMSPPHIEEKHLHDHRDIDLHVFPNKFAALVLLLKERGYHRQPTRFDNPSGEFVRFEKYIFSCPLCREHGEYWENWYDSQKIEHQKYICLNGHLFDDAIPIKVIFDLFVIEGPSITIDGYTIVEPNHLLTFYGIKHSSEQCVAVQAARRLQAAGKPIAKNPELVTVKYKKERHL